MNEMHCPYWLKTNDLNTTTKVIDVLAGTRNDGGKDDINHQPNVEYDRTLFDNYNIPYTKNIQDSRQTNLRC